jgi:predicted lactoylglutathione lyase/uncharacterized protein YndB with AHSA1/START domain
MSIITEDPRDIITTRLIDRTPEEIYAAFVDPALLAQWWGPRGFTNTFETFEFRQGGLWRFTMHGPDGTDYANEIHFEAIEPMSRIVMRHTNAPQFTLTTELAPEGGKTRMTWTQRFESAEMRNQLAGICVPANEQNFDRLEATLALASKEARRKARSPVTRQIFVNLPIRDMERSKAFFSALGFSFNPQFTNEQGACMVVADNIFVMLLVEPFFQTFTKKPVADASQTTEVLVCISCESRAEVDEFVGKALVAGGTAPNAPQDHGFMYSHGFQDLDGHIWELAYMDASALPPQA